jgi:hypothetical protein
MVGAALTAAGAPGAVSAGCAGSALRDGSIAPRAAAALQAALLGIPAPP